MKEIRNWWRSLVVLQFHCSYLPTEPCDWFCDRSLYPLNHCDRVWGHSLGRGAASFIPGRWHTIRQVDVHFTITMSREYIAHSLSLVRHVSSLLLHRPDSRLLVVKSRILWMIHYFQYIAPCFQYIVSCFQYIVSCFQYIPLYFQYIQMNNPNTSNGVMRYYLDGVLRFEISGLRIRNVSAVYPDTLYFSTFFGGSSTRYFAAPNDCYIYFRRFRIFNWTLKDFRMNFTKTVGWINFVTIRQVN